MDAGTVYNHHKVFHTIYPFHQSGDENSRSDRYWVILIVGDGEENQ